MSNIDVPTPPSGTGTIPSTDARPKSFASEPSAPSSAMSAMPSTSETPAVPPAMPAANRTYPAFLNKLRSMVDDPETNELIRWSPSGKSIFICHPQRFSTELLPRFFLHRRYSSFVRQLNMYGFHKVPHLQTGALMPMWSGSQPATAGSTSTSTTTTTPSLPNTRSAAEEQEDNLAINAFHSAGLANRPSPSPVGSKTGKASPNSVQADELELNEFMHEYFQRNRPDLMQLVVRKKAAASIAGKKHARSKDEDAEEVEEPPDRAPNSLAMLPPPPMAPYPWSMPMGLLEPPPAQPAAASTPALSTPSTPMSTALTPYLPSISFVPPGVNPGLFEAILASQGMQNNPAAAAVLAATLTGSNPTMGYANPAGLHSSTPGGAHITPAMINGTHSGPGAGTDTSHPTIPSEGLSGNGYGLPSNSAAAAPGAIPIFQPNAPNLPSNGISPNAAWAAENGTLNLAAILQTLQTTQADLVREVAHLRSTQARLWQDRQEEKRKYRKHHDALQRILRFLGGVFGTHNTPAILSADDTESGNRASDQFTELGLDADLDQQGNADEDSYQRSARKRPRQSQGAESTASSPHSANIYELLNTPGSQGSPSSRHVSPHQDPMRSPPAPSPDSLPAVEQDNQPNQTPAWMLPTTRRRFMIEGPAGWQPDANADLPQVDADRFTRLGSPPALDDNAAGSHAYPHPTQAPPPPPPAVSRWREHDPNQRIVSPRPKPATPRLSAKQRADVFSALQTDQVSSWLAQLANAAGQPGHGSSWVPPSPSRASSNKPHSSSAAAEFARALNQTDTQAQSMQRSIAALAESLRQNSQPQAAQTILDNQQAFVRGMAAFQNPDFPASSTSTDHDAAAAAAATTTTATTTAHAQPAAPPLSTPRMYNTPASMPLLHSVPPVPDPAPALGPVEHEDPSPSHTEQDDLAFFNQFLDADNAGGLSDVGHEVCTPLPAQRRDSSAAPLSPSMELGNEDAFSFSPLPAFEQASEN